MQNLDRRSFTALSGLAALGAAMGVPVRGAHAAEAAPRSVNRALAMRRPAEDALLLNADTVLPRGAVDRLAAAVHAEAGSLQTRCRLRSSSRRPDPVDGNPLSRTCLRPSPTGARLHRLFQGTINTVSDQLTV